MLCWQHVVEPTASDDNYDLKDPDYGVYPAY